MLGLLRFPIAIVLAYGTLYYVVLRNRPTKTYSTRHPEHVHEWMLASDSQLYVLCQHPRCDEERVYVGDPLTIADIERLSGTKAIYKESVDG